MRSIVVGALHPFSTPRSPQTSSSTAGVRSFTLKIRASSFCTRVGIHLRDRAVPELPCDGDRGDGGRREAALTLERAGRVQLPGDHPDCGRASKRVARMRQGALAERFFFGSTRQTVLRNSACRLTVEAHPEPQSRSTPLRKVRIRCRQCHRRIRWTKKKCPHCFHRNERRPLMIFLKVSAFVVICVAIWYTVRFIIVAYDTGSGVLR